MSRAIERAADAVNPVNSDEIVTRWVLTAIKVNISLAGAHIHEIQPYDLTPIVLFRRRLPGRGASGFPVNTASNKSAAKSIMKHMKSGPVKELKPGEFVPRLTASYRAKGCIEIPELKGIEDWPLVRKIQQKLFPKALFESDQDLYARVRAHLEEVVEEVGEDSLIGKIARRAIQSNQLGAERREKFFLDASSREQGTVPIHRTEESWLRQLSKDIPENFRSKTVISEKPSSRRLEEAVLLLAEKAVQAPPPDIDALVAARFDQLLAERGIALPKPETAKPGKSPAAAKATKAEDAE